MNAVMEISDEERSAGILEPSRFEEASRLLYKHGWLWLKNCFNREFIERLRDIYFERYASLPQEVLKKSALQVGHARFMITVDVVPPFNDPSLYGNSLYLPVLRQLLGQQCVLDSYGSVCAFPGSGKQHVHIDHPNLFGGFEAGKGLPPHAITAVIPLIDIDLSVGTTAIWEGSHQDPNYKELLNKMKQSSGVEGATLPTPRMGDVYFMDYRVIHGGMPNESDGPRPIMYMVYSRPWFRDSANFSLQATVKISPEELEKVPQELKPLFRLTRPSVNA